MMSYGIWINLTFDRGQIPKRCIEDPILAIQTNAVWLPFAGAVCEGRAAASRESLYIVFLFYLSGDLAKC